MNKLLGLASLGCVILIAGCQSDGCLFGKRQPPPQLPPPPMPAGSVPFGAMPNGALPNGATPNGAIPNGVIPNGAIPNGAVPTQPFPTVPPNGIPTNPPMGANPFPTVPPPPPPVPPGVGAALPQGNPNTQVEFRWQPSENKVQLKSPVPITDADDKKSATANENPNPNPKANAGLPVGIPQFASARDNVAAGLRPSLDDGLDWLQARGYKTVLHVRAPGDMDDADRKAVEKRGMTYASLEVSPETLNKMTLDEFTRVVRDAAGQPLFVYDRDGSLAGGLWFLFYRSAEGHSEDVARIRAASLGFREDRDAAHRAMWTAIQDFLRGSKSE